jgi:hypothetical protein
MAGALITASAGEFAEALPGHGGKLAGLDVGTRTIGLALCDAGWHFAGPSETIKRTKFTQDLDYTFQSDGRVKGTGGGGTYYSKSYSYSKPTIKVVWDGGGTETITLQEAQKFSYLGNAGTKTYSVTGTWTVIGTCEAAK